MKYSGVEWIGEIPDKWNLVRLKDICINKKEVAGEKSSEYERLALTLNGVIKRPKDDQEGLQPKEFDTYQILEENDFVFKMIDLQNISTSRVGLSPYTGLVSPAYIRFASKKKGQFNEFIHYYLLSLWHNCVYNNIAGDGVRSALNATDMGNLKCPYPTEDQQRKIAGFLNKKTAEIDSLIEIENQQIQKLKEYKQAVVVETITKGLDRNAPMKDSGVEWIGIINKESSLVRLRFLVDVETGNQDTQNAVEDGKYPFYVRSPKIERNNEYSFDGPGILMAGDGAGAGRVFHYAEGKYAVHQRVYRFSNFRLIKPRLLKYYLETMFPKVMEYGSAQTTVPSVRLPMILDFQVVIPYSQDRVVEFLDKKIIEIDSLITLKQEKIVQLEDYKKSLIYEYVTGKKEVC